MLLSFLLSSMFLGESEGLKFFEGSWENVLKEAAKTNQGVMADFSTEW